MKPITLHPFEVRAAIECRLGQVRRPVIPNKCYGPFDGLNKFWARETWALCPVYEKTLYKASGDSSPMPGVKWRSPVTMHSWASRITLTVGSVRVERLQEMRESDAKKCGVTGNCPIGHIPSWLESPYLYHYPQEWDNYYSKRGYSWDDNPWVWVADVTAEVKR